MIKKLLATVALLGLAGPAWAANITYPAFVAGAPSAGTVQGTDAIPVVRSGTTTYGTTASGLATYIQGTITSGVSSVFGRQGAVVATSGDYSFPLISGNLSLTQFPTGGAQGDILYQGAAGWAFLAPGTSGNCLTTNGASANPSWGSCGTGSGVTWPTSGDVVISNGTNSPTGIGYGLTGNSVLAETTSGGLLTPSILPLATTGAFGAVKPDGTTITVSGGVISAATGGGGTVTSVGLALPSIFTVSGSPVTGTGTLTGALNTETANTVFAGPASGAAADPTFRTLTAADLPPFPVTYETSSHTIVAGDLSSYLVYNSASAGTFTLPQAGTTGFGNGASVCMGNASTGALTIATTGSSLIMLPTNPLTENLWACAVSDGTNWAFQEGTGAASGSGTVTSVGLSTPSWLTVSGSPVTGSGTLAMTAATGQTANEVLASPNGTTGAVSLRGLALADLPSIANDTVLGNASGASAVPSALSQTQLTALVNSFSATLSGAVPASGGGTSNYLRADGTWAAPTGSGTVNSGTSGQATYYGATGSAVSGTAGLTFSSTAITSYIGTVIGVATTSCTLGTTTSSCSAQTTGDCGTFINFTASTAVTVTIPDTLPRGCQVALMQQGTGSVSLTAGSGATLETPHSFTGKTAGQYSTIGVTIISNTGGTAAVAVMTGDGA